jgi:hypothetical protein
MVSCDGANPMNGQNQDFEVRNGKFIRLNSSRLNSSIETIDVPEGITELSQSCFYGCWILSSVTIPNSVKSLPDYCFYGCSSLVSLTLPDSIQTIGNSCFYGCASLVRVAIPNSVESLPGFCFCGCRSLVSVAIPNSVISIVNLCFYGCESLQNLEIFSQTQVNAYVFAGVPFFGDKSVSKDYSALLKLRDTAVKKLTDNLKKLAEDSKAAQKLAGTLETEEEVHEWMYGTENKKIELGKVSHMHYANGAWSSNILKGFYDRSFNEEQMKINFRNKDRQFLTDFVNDKYLLEPENFKDIFEKI